MMRIGFYIRFRDVRETTIEKQPKLIKKFCLAQSDAGEERPSIRDASDYGNKTKENSKFSRYQFEQKLFYFCLVVGSRMFHQTLSVISVNI